MFLKLCQYYIINTNVAKESDRKKEEHYKCNMDIVLAWAYGQIVQCAKTSNKCI